MGVFNKKAKITGKPPGAIPLSKVRLLNRDAKLENGQGKFVLTFALLAVAKIPPNPPFQRGKPKSPPFVKGDFR
jgi:hypothetical protein